MYSPFEHKARGVIHQDVKLSVCSLHLVHEGTHEGFLGDVHDCRHCSRGLPVLGCLLVVECRGGGIGPLCVHVHHIDLGAFSVESFANGGSNPGAAAFWGWVGGA